MPRALAVVVLVAAALLGGCSGGAAPIDVASPGPDPGGGAPPEVEIPEGPPPGELVVETLVEGEGPAAEPGDGVAVRYVGARWSDGEVFDAAWGPGQTFRLTLGEGGVIEGWERGLQGIAVGERRRLVIPPDLAYGEAGVPGVIPADETLVFVVEAAGIEPA